MRSTQDTWTKLIDSEYKKQVEKPEETPGGLAEYVIAVANDQIKCADFAEEMSSRLEAIVSEKYKKEIEVVRKAFPADEFKWREGTEGTLKLTFKEAVDLLVEDGVPRENLDDIEYVRTDRSRCLRH